MRRVVATVIVLAGLMTTASLVRTIPASAADGLQACSVGPPPNPWRGACGTFNGYNTYYGLDGLGFPTPLGWGMCAMRPASGSGYPSPGYRYAPSAAPSGSNLSRNNQLGWAFSQAQALGWWVNGRAGRFSANEIGVAAKLLYDNVVWGIARPGTVATISNAYNDLLTLMNSVGAITATPVLNVALVGGGSTLETHGTIRATVTVPGSNLPLAGQAVTLTLSGATFVATGSSSLATNTNASGVVEAEFHATSLHPSSITVTASSTVAEPGLLYYGPTYIILNAQTISTPRAPVLATRVLALNALGVQTGTIRVHKSGDDEPYLPVSNAVFHVINGVGQVVDTLITNHEGLSPISMPLRAGTYTLREVTPPIGYQSAPDRSVAVSANHHSEISVGPAQGNRAITGTVTIDKIDALARTPVSGATFELFFDQQNNSHFGDTRGRCVTDHQGHCGWVDLLPGWYQLHEVHPPSEYAPDATPRTFYLEGTENYLATWVNHPLEATIYVHKFNASGAVHVGVPDATYDLYVRAPFPPGVPVTTPHDAAEFPGLQFAQRGTTNHEGQLAFHVRAGYQWCVQEVSAPPAYIVDPALHCTGTIERASTPIIALPEKISSLHLQVRKFNASRPNLGVPNAFYALFVRHPFPTGFSPAPTPTDITVPDGTSLWGINHTDAAGHLVFTIPAGNSWCVQEITAPPGYVLDPVVHCTGVLMNDAPLADVTVAVPEVLAATGSHDHLYGEIAALFLALGVSLLELRRRYTLRS